KQVMSFIAFLTDFVSIRAHIQFFSNTDLRNYKFIFFTEATSLNGINIIEVRNSMPSIGKHKNIALSKGFNRMSLIKFDPSYENRMVGLASPIRASGNKASH
ncbi:hypothetical protein ACJX0J_009523, partial [Zea mays]